MKITYCDCCGIKITEAEQRYSIEIMKGCDKEHILEDVCYDCYSRIKSIIDNARKWRHDANR